MKSGVVRGAEAELFVVAPSSTAGRSCSSSSPRPTASPSSPTRRWACAPPASRGSCSTTSTVEQIALLGDAEDYRECVRFSRLAWCALAVGTAQAVLDYVTPYVKEREAFGEPIAHRQSVAFMVANIAIELQGMRLVTLKAASRVAQGKPAAREIALARRLCAERGMQIGLDGVQLLGGHGFVKEHPVERWYRDLRAIGLMEGAVLV